MSIETRGLNPLLNCVGEKRLSRQGEIMTAYHILSHTHVLKKPRPLYDVRNRIFKIQKQISDVWKRILNVWNRISDVRKRILNVRKKKFWRTKKSFECAKKNFWRAKKSFECAKTNFWHLKKSFGHSKTVFSPKNPRAKNSKKPLESRLSHVWALCPYFQHWGALCQAQKQRTAFVSPRFSEKNKKHALITYYVARLLRK